MESFTRDRVGTNEDDVAPENVVYIERVEMSDKPTVDEIRDDSPYTTPDRFNKKTIARTAVITAGVLGGFMVYGAVRRRKLNKK